MSVVFARYGPAQGRSFALKLFNEHETEINEHFWSFKVISEWAAFQARKSARANPLFATQTLFRASGPDARRVPPTVTEWLTARDGLENWLRLSALASASSFLEVYLRQVTRTALMSDPMCRFGASRTVDGLALLKAGAELPYEDCMVLLTKGDWNSRAAGYSSIFGTAPAGLSTHISILEKVRKLRNEFAHGFGASVKALVPTETIMPGRRTISQPTFISYIGTISKVAAAIDAHLSVNYIGSFELLYHYHHWKDQPILASERKYDRIRQLKRSIIRDLHCNVGKGYCEQLVKFYDSI
jgi:hypothetical protein